MKKTYLKYAIFLLVVPSFDCPESYSEERNWKVSQFALMCAWHNMHCKDRRTKIECVKTKHKLATLHESSKLFKIWIDGSPMITMDNCLRETHSTVIHLSIFEMQPWRRLERKQHCLQDCTCWVWNTLGGSNNSLHSKTAKGRSKVQEKVSQFFTWPIVYAPVGVQTSAPPGCLTKSWWSPEMQAKDVKVTQKQQWQVLISLGLLEKEGKGVSICFYDIHRASWILFSALLCRSTCCLGGVLLRFCTIELTWSGTGEWRICSEVKRVVWSVSNKPATDRKHLKQHYHTLDPVTNHRDVTNCRYSR